MYLFSCPDNTQKVIDMFQYFTDLKKNLPLLHFKCAKKFNYSKCLLKLNHFHFIYFHLNAILTISPLDL